MTGCRKSCKKAATGSLPFMEMSVPVVDGIYYKNNDHKENRTPGFPSRSTDANSDPATAGTAAADPALGRTESTPGLRKTAHRKLAIQASSFTAVVQQTTQQAGLAGDKDMEERRPDNERADDKNNSNASGKEKDDSACGDRNGPKGVAGCSDQHAPKAKVAVSVTADPLGATHTGIQAATTISGTGGIPAVVVPVNGNDVHGGRANQGENHHSKHHRVDGDDTPVNKHILKSAKDAFSCKNLEKGSHGDSTPKDPSKPLLLPSEGGMQYFLEQLNSHLESWYRQTSKKEGVRNWSVIRFANFFLDEEYRDDPSKEIHMEPLTKGGTKFAEKYKRLHHDCWRDTSSTHHHCWSREKFVPGLMKLIHELRFLRCMIHKFGLKDNLEGAKYGECLSVMNNLAESGPCDKKRGICWHYSKLGVACNKKMTLYDDAKYSIKDVPSDVLYNTKKTAQNKEEEEEEEEEEEDSNGNQVQEVEEGIENKKNKEGGGCHR